MRESGWESCESSSFFGLASVFGPALRKLLGRGNWCKVAPGKHVLEQIHQLVLNQPIRSQNLATVKPERVAGKVRHLSPGFLHQQDAGRCVPRIEVELPERLQAPGGHVSQIQRGRPRAPHSVRAQRELVVEVDIRTRMALAAGKAGRLEA